MIEKIIKYLNNIALSEMEKALVTDSKKCLSKFLKMNMDNCFRTKLYTV